MSPPETAAEAGTSAGAPLLLTVRGAMLAAASPTPDPSPAAASAFLARCPFRSARRGRFDRRSPAPPATVASEAVSPPVSCSASSLAVGLVAAAADRGPSAGVAARARLPRFPRGGSDAAAAAPEATAVAGGRTAWVPSVVTSSGSASRRRVVGPPPEAAAAATDRRGRRCDIIPRGSAVAGTISALPPERRE